MKERILKVLENARNKALTTEEIFKKTGYQSDMHQDFVEYFEDLKDEKKIYCVNSNKGLYTLNPYREGIIHMRRNGTCYATIGDKEVEIHNSFGAMDRDKVLVKITDFNTYEATIKEIVERQGIIAEIKTINKEKFAVVSDTKYKIDLDCKLVDGMLVGIKVDKTKAGKFYHATLDRVIGHKNAPKMDEQKILYEFGVPTQFSQEALNDLNDINYEITEEELKNRRDLRKETIFTIDGDDTKDIDDAISVKKLENGNFLLGVHIADVSHYIKENSALDEEARARGTSVYTPGVVNPMYPPELSNGICSLNPDEDRLAMSCQMEIDHNGKLIDFDIFKSIIHSRIQMTYKKVNKILNENIIPEGYEEYADTLKTMKSLANILKSSRGKRGMLDFDRPELKILVDEDGKVLEITKRVQDTGENLIEVFMLAANECVATYVYNMGLPFIYRVHDYPNEEKLRETIKIIKSYGEQINTNLNINDPKLIQKLLDELKNNPNYDIYSNMILRCMAKASYKTTNYGHFGIGVSSQSQEAYTHFTSPIRRYPDSMVHRILTYILNANIDKISTDEYKALLNEISSHSSEMELTADKCEREAEKMKMADYMSKYIGQIFSGRINGFTKTGMYVELNNLVEGRVGYSTMDDYYRYDEQLGVLVGERSKKVYRLGDKVDIKVIRSDKEAREIDFELAKVRKR